MMKIKIYSTPTCPWCHKAKDYLTDKKVKFEYIDVSVDEKARDEMIEKSGQMGVPVIEINKKIIVGFDREEIDAELKKTK